MPPVLEKSASVPLCWLEYAAKIQNHPTTGPTADPASMIQKLTRQDLRASAGLGDAPCWRGPVWYMHSMLAYAFAVRSYSIATGELRSDPTVTRHSQRPRTPGQVAARASLLNGGRGSREDVGVSESRFAALSDRQWEQIQWCLPSSDGRRGRPYRDSHRSSGASSTGTAPGTRGAIFRESGSGRGRRSGSGIAATPLTAHGITSSMSSSPRPMRPGRSPGTFRSTRRSRMRIGTRAT